MLDRIARGLMRGWRRDPIRPRCGFPAGLPTRAGPAPICASICGVGAAARLPLCRMDLRDWLHALQRVVSRGAANPPDLAIGPMVPFARVPELIVQPESWFELGNPNVQTICIDLGYRWPGGGHPIFTSGDDALGEPPRIIARSFEEWFLELIATGGAGILVRPGFCRLGRPLGVPPPTCRGPALAASPLSVCRPGGRSLAIRRR